MRKNLYLLKLCAFLLAFTFSKQLKAQVSFDPAAYYTIKQVSTTAVTDPKFGAAINVNDSVYWVANDKSLSYGSKSDGCYPLRKDDFSDSTRSAFWTIDSTSGTTYRFTNLGSVATNIKNGGGNPIPYLSNWINSGNDIYMGPTGDNRYNWAVTSGTSGYLAKHSTGYYITTDLRDLTDIRGVLITNKSNQLGSAANIVITKTIVAKNALATTLTNANDALNNTPSGDAPDAARTRLTNAIPVAQTAYNAINASTVSVYGEFKALYVEYKAFTDSTKPSTTLMNSLLHMLDSAKTIRDNSVIGTAGGNYPSAAHTTFSGTITTVQAFYDSNPNYTLDVNTQISTLKTAISTFYSSIIIDGYYTISIGNRYVTEDTAGWQNATTYFPILKNGPSNDGTQWFKFTKESNGRYKIESFSINTSLSYISGTQTYINESGQFGRNAYSLNWNSMNIYTDGSKFAIQGYANNASKLRSYDTTTIKVTRTGMHSYCWAGTIEQAALPANRFYMVTLTPVTISQKISWIVFPLTYGTATSSDQLTAKMMSNYGTTGAATYTIDSLGTVKPLVAGMKLNAGTYPVTVTFAADANFPEISKTVNLVVKKATPPAADPIPDMSVTEGVKLNEVTTFTGFTGYTAGLSGISFTVDGNAVNSDVVLTASAAPYTVIATFTDPNYITSVKDTFNLTVNVYTQTPKSLASSNVTLYPNPVSKGYVKVNVPAGGGKIVVTSVSGAVILSKSIQGTVTEVDMNTLAPGLYLFKVTTPAGMITKKVIKQ